MITTERKLEILNFIIDETASLLCDDEQKYLIRIMRGSPGSIPIPTDTYNNIQTEKQKLLAELRDEKLNTILNGKEIQKN